jgi:acetolactate synthase-1/2/3 large subunit
MNGAESLVNTLVDQGVDICFANPGTSEMHFLAALENPRMRSVLCLFEGVATGAADGWYRMKDKPASTLLHLGPGLANGLANIHNAKRASSGMVNIIGEHSTSHLKYDPPLTSDIEGLARPLSHWVRRADSAGAIAWDAAQAVAKASEHPGRIATLILPGDTSWQKAEQAVLPPAAEVQRKAPDLARVEHIARVLRSGEPALLILANKATRGLALQHAGQVAAATGARLGSQFFTARIERGAGRVPLERIPYAVPQARAFLKGFKHIVTVEAREPVAFFAYPDQPSLLKAEGCQVHTLSEDYEDSALAFEMLLDALGARATPALLQPRILTPPPSGALNPLSIAHALAAALPENAILVDRLCDAGGHRCGAGLPGPAGVLHGRRRQRDVHHPVALDPGARGPEHHHHHLRQQQLRHPQGRVRQYGCRCAGGACLGHDRYRQAPHLLAVDGQEHGRAGRRRRHGRGLPQGHARLDA